MSLFPAGSAVFGPEVDAFGRLVAAGATLHALAVCGDGQPSHPLMLPNSATPTPWRRP